MGEGPEMADYVRTIWKFPVAIEDYFELHMSACARVLSVQTQNGDPCLWAEVDPNAKTVPRVFRVFGTDNPISAEKRDRLRYIGTFQMMPYVWHLYEKE